MHMTKKITSTIKKLDHIISKEGKTASNHFGPFELSSCPSIMQTHGRQRDVINLFLPPILLKSSILATHSAHYGSDNTHFIINHIRSSMKILPPIAIL